MVKLLNHLKYNKLLIEMHANAYMLCFLNGQSKIEFIYEVFIYHWQICCLNSCKMFGSNTILKILFILVLEYQ